MGESRVLHPTAESVFDSVLKEAESKFKIERKDNELGIRLLSMFSSLSAYERLYVHQVTEFTGVGSPFIILLLEKHQIVPKNLSSGMRYLAEIEEVEPVLVFSLPVDIGHVTIKPETLGDKIADLFTKQDIDFSVYPQFSKNYMLLGENPELVRQHLPVGLIKMLEKFQGLNIEIDRNVGLLRSEKNLSTDTLLQLITIGHQISNQVIN